MPHTDPRLYDHTIRCHTHTHCFTYLLQSTLGHTQIHVFTITRYCATYSFTSLLSKDTVPQTVSNLFRQKTLHHTTPNSHTPSRPYHTYKFWSWFYTSFLQYRHDSTRVSSPYEYTLLVYSVIKPTNCTCKHKCLLFWDIVPTCNDPNRISAGRSFTKECIYKHAFLCKWLPWRWLVGLKHVEGAAQNNKYFCLHVKLVGLNTP